MGRRLGIMAVLGSVQRPSRTLVLVEQLLAALAEVFPVDVHLITLEELTSAIGGMSYRDQSLGRMQTEPVVIESAGVLIIRSPVYRSSYTGLFKHLFGLVHHEALIDASILLAATGGSNRHTLVIDRQLRPLFGLFQVHTLPLGIYVPEQGFSGHEITSQAPRERIAPTITRTLPLLSASSVDDLRIAPVAQAT